MEDKLYFDRDEKGNLIPIKDIINTKNNLILEQCNNYQERFEKETNETNKKIFQEIIKLLQEEYDKSGEDLDITFIPIMLSDYIKYQRGLNKLSIKSDNLEEDILKEHLIEPKLKEDNSLNMYRLKKKIVEFIYLRSIPDYNKNEDLAKKVITLLAKIE